MAIGDGCDDCDGYFDPAPPLLFYRHNRHNRHKAYFDRQMWLPERVRLWW